VLIPSITFILGALVVKILEEYLKERDPVLLALEALILCTVVLVYVTIAGLRHANASNETTSVAMERLAEALGLSVRYVEDGETGESYRRATELVRGAQESLTFVDLWQPYAYGSDDSERGRSRGAFYSAIIDQVERHRNDDGLFHRRIVQLPEGYDLGDMPTDADPVFWKYLRRMCEIQAKHPNACIVRYVAKAVIKTHLVIVDRRYIVIPLLSVDQDTGRQTRHGALFFDDRDGTLFRALRGIYRAIDAHANAMTSAVFVRGGGA
jgi:hypothetical protein